MKANVLLLSGLMAAAVAVPASLRGAEAKANWKVHCAKCHAEDGSGETSTGRKLGVRDYRDPKVQAKMEERTMIKVTRGGLKEKEREVMKPFGGKLSDEEIRALVAHIRTFEKK